MSDHNKETHGRECKGSIPIVPFRYAIMPKVEGDSTQYYYDACPTKLDKGFDKLDTAAYSIRTLRPGYIYLYDEDLGTTYLWEADEGKYTSLQWTSLEKYESAIKKVGSPMENITVCDESNDVYIAYSQDLWTNNQVKKNIANRQKFMVKLNIQEILNGSKSNSTQEHVLPSDHPEDWIEEYKTPKDSYEDQFGWSNYTPDNIVQISNLKTLATPYAEMHRPKLPVFIALYDSVATVIDQGHITGLYMHQLTDIKNKIKDVEFRKENTFNNADNREKVDAIPVPAAMTLDTNQLHSLTSDFYHKKVMSDIIESILGSSYPKGKLKHATRIAKETLQNHVTNRRRTVGSKEAQLFALVNPHTNKGVDKILGFIDYDKMQTFNKEWEAEQGRFKTIEARVMQASKDHCTLLKTMEEDQATHPRNIACQLATYDRDSVFSAMALEVCVASCMRGMGTPLPGRFEKDPRFALTGEWVKNKNSPLYLGLKAFNPLKDKLDSAGDFVGNLGNIPDVLFSDMKAVNIIVKEVTTYATYKISTSSAVVTNTSVAVQNSRQVLKNVHSTVSVVGGNLDELVKVIAGRYGIVESKISSSGVTKSYIDLLELEVSPNSASAQRTTASATQGTHSTTTNIRIDKISMNKVIGKIGSAGLSGGASFLHILNLQTALKSFGKSDSIANSLNLGSAVFGATAAFTETIIASTLGYQAVRQRIVGIAARKAIEKSLLAKLSGPIQFIAAVFEAGALGFEAFQLGSKGDNDAAIWAGTAGFAFGLAGLIGASSAAVGSGLVAAGSALGALALTGVGLIVVIGVLLIAGFIALFMKFRAEDRPLDIWVSRTIFGISRRDRLGYGKVVDTPFKNLAEALKGYYAVSYSPIAMPDTKKLSSQAETDWEEHGAGNDEAKFCFLLPGYLENASDYDYKMEGYDGGNVNSDEDRIKDKVLERRSKRRIKLHETKQTKEGLYVYLSAFFQNFSTDSAGLAITYYPQGRENESVLKYLYVDD